MTEKDFEKLKAGETVVYKGRSPLGEDFKRGKLYEVAENSECHSIIGIYDDNDKERLFRHAQAQDVFCSQEEWNTKWQYVYDRDDMPNTSKLPPRKVIDWEVIDWEQRRYEIAKAAMVGLLAAPVIEGIDPNPSLTSVCKWAVAYADALTDELKKSHTQG